MTSLSKVFTREHTLFFFSVWNASEKKELLKWVGRNIQNLLYLREGNLNKVSVWYNLDELNEVGEILLEKMPADPTYHDRMTSTLNQAWQKVAPYFEQNKQISSLEELQEFSENLIRWWAPMALNFVIPDTEGIPEDIKIKALEIRGRDERYSDALDRPFVEFWKKHYPDYAGLLYVITPDEAIALAKGETTGQDMEVLKKRLEGFALLNNELYLLEDFQKALNDQGLVLKEEKVGGDVREIKGNPASKGLAKGKVQVISLKNQISELQEGEILVTEMTNPDYVPAMQKAAAIVTDEGGITCHAAIVSRELGKPCVIGTKIATKALKNGDLVEVDANKGVVRKLQD